MELRQGRAGQVGDRVEQVRPQQHRQADPVARVLGEKAGAQVGAGPVPPAPGARPARPHRDMPLRRTRADPGTGRAGR